MHVLSQNLQALQAPACLKQAHADILPWSATAHKWAAKAAREARQVHRKVARAQDLLEASLQLKRCANVRSLLTQRHFPEGLLLALVAALVTFSTLHTCVPTRLPPQTPIRRHIDVLCGASLAYPELELHVDSALIHGSFQEREHGVSPFLAFGVCSALHGGRTATPSASIIRCTKNQSTRACDSCNVLVCEVGARGETSGCTQM